MHARTAVKWAITAAAWQPAKPSVSVLKYREVNCSSFIDLQFIPLPAVLPIPFYLTVFSILTPDGAHLSPPEKATGDFWKGAPAVNKREYKSARASECDRETHFNLTSFCKSHTSKGYFWPCYKAGIRTAEHASIYASDYSVCPPMTFTPVAM